MGALPDARGLSEIDLKVEPRRATLSNCAVGVTSGFLRPDLFSRERLKSLQRQAISAWNDITSVRQDKADLVRSSEET